MASYVLNINGKDYPVDVQPEMPLLWVLRDVVGLTGTKYGCGISLCGSCTVHVDGKAIRACMEPVSGIDGRPITTIEGLSDGTLHPVQQAWDEFNVAQCGYCQAGQIMNAAAWLKDHPDPTEEEIDRYQAANLCRCGTYPRIRAAIVRAAELAR